MKRTIIKIDEDLCNGCELCVEGCHEGALQMIDGKARMISDLYCDGLGACIPECPTGAITLEEREAEPYDEIRVLERILPKGESTVMAHLNHLIDHNQAEYVQQGIEYLQQHAPHIDLSKLKSNNNHKEMNTKDAVKEATASVKEHLGGGCPGSRMMNFDSPQIGAENSSAPNNTDQPSQLRQWPVQMHLVNPQAPYFQRADVLLAADCVAFSMGDFHSKYLNGKGLAIACPKLDQGKDLYVDKLVGMIDQAEINTLTVMVMEVPCCTGLIQLAQKAADKAGRKVPVKAITVSLQGKIIQEEWI